MNTSEKFWDRASKNYDKTEERFEYIHSRSRTLAKKHIKSSNIVLDYGCGTGTASCALAGDVREIHGIDISFKMVELSRGRAMASSIRNATFLQADIFDERFEQESFDVVLAFNMLHTVANPERVLQRIHAVLKPDGVLISVTPCLRDKMSPAVWFQIQMVRIMCKIGVIPIPIRRLKSSTLDGLMANGDFQVVESEEIYRGASSYFVAAKPVHRGSSPRLGDAVCG